jgi:hypothetical protein
MSILSADHRGHENLLPEVCRVAAGNPALFRRHRRFLRFVDTRQKWLLLHLLAEMATPVAGRGIAANWAAERAAALGIASRNTSLAFFAQLQAYGFLVRHTSSGDRRIKSIALAEPAREALRDWTRMLVSVVTGGGDTALSDDEIDGVYLATVSALLADRPWITPPLDIALTQDMRGGWLVMSDIVCRLVPASDKDGWPVAKGLAIPALAAAHGLSRSTLYRLVRCAVDAGIMAWQVREGESLLAVNPYHLGQHARWVGRLLSAVRTALAERSAAPREDPSPRAIEPCPVVPSTLRTSSIDVLTA